MEGTTSYSRALLIFRHCTAARGVMYGQYNDVSGHFTIPSVSASDTRMARLHRRCELKGEAATKSFRY